MKNATSFVFAAIVLVGCANSPGFVTVGGDYRAAQTQDKGQHIQVTVYGDRTLVKSPNLSLSFFDKNTSPIQAEYLNGYYLFPTLIEAFYMKAENNYLIVQLDEATRIYNIGKVRTE
ncbi:hypothetical protein EII19_13305 [Comamonadaceae bacterium OH2310_COT-174]|nr:hypothetical protein EII19_13305 [Comamonadaceae bacterium OH2310_COT-174]